MVTPHRVLATRCPDCHTVFRVVADQLKLRDGLVRCGTCHHVFDGRAALCEPPGDMNDTNDSVAAPLADIANVTAIADTSSTHTANEAPAIDPAAVPRLFDAAHSVPSAAVPQPTDADATASDHAATAPISALVSHDALVVSDSNAAQNTPPSFAFLRAEDTTVSPPLAHPGNAVDDITDARADNFDTVKTASAVPPSHRGYRIAWRIAAGLAVLMLAGQWVWLDREVLIDRWPALRLPIAQWATLTHHTVAPAHVRDALSLETVTLETAPLLSENGATATAHDTTLILTVFLRNKAAHPVAYPALELTLSNTEATPVVRRVFRATDYQSDTQALAAGLPAHSEHTIRLRLTSQPSQMALAGNFRVLAFYP